ncbi:SPOR domain-containing protein [Methyloceanibacter superfactus]|uniref:SPOR domain-containing protein n=1 Tax=Methyloceanibacter superfactus TaxID=1774969 RepID=UPI0009F3929F|nr:SPOR domain-containing protein [Methyloceanibacter superfactus]
MRRNRNPSRSPQAARRPMPRLSPLPRPRTSRSPLRSVTLPPAANDGSTRYGIEIGTVGKRDELRPLWREFLTNHAALVAGLQPRRILAPDKKWRLIAGPFANAQDAEGACSLFKKADRPCAATVYAGDAL